MPPDCLVDDPDLRCVHNSPLRRLRTIQDGMRVATATSSLPDHGHTTDQPTERCFRPSRTQGSGSVGAPSGRTSPQVGAAASQQLGADRRRAALRLCDPGGARLRAGGHAMSVRRGRSAACARIPNVGSMLARDGRLLAREAASGGRERAQTSPRSRRPGAAANAPHRIPSEADLSARRGRGRPATGGTDDQGGS
jgi:hypothetical protein